MHPLTKIPFLKMNGIGNAILVVDLRHTDYVLTPEDARAIAKGPQTGFDQLMVLYPPRHADSAAFMTIFNCDGSLSAACGNGTRCVAWALMAETDKTSLKVESDAGLLLCTKNDDWHFSVDMGLPRLNWQDIPLSFSVLDTNHVRLEFDADLASLLPVPSLVNMGNPHAIFFVDDVQGLDVETIGPVLEHHKAFPEKANISFAKMIKRDEMVLKARGRFNTGLWLRCVCSSGCGYSSRYR
jgi:diaminopimelate epimerase